jgi:hypothetical protein
MTMAKKRKRSGDFDPAQSLAELVNALGRQIDGGPGSDCQHVVDRADAATEDFKRGLVALYRAEGDSSGVEVLLGELERVARRATRLAAEHGAAPASERDLEGGAWSHYSTL